MGGRVFTWKKKERFCKNWPELQKKSAPLAAHHVLLNNLEGMNLHNHREFVSLKTVFFPTASSLAIDGPDTSSNLMYIAFAQHAFALSLQEQLQFQAFEQDFCTSGRGVKQYMDARSTHI